MKSNCQNCEQLIVENFCSNCGQKKFKRIDKKYIWDEIQYTFLHTNKGFLYSVKNIIKNPGKTAKSFIDGNRVNHYKPILLAFVLSGISAFISFKILGLKEIMSAFYAAQKMNSEFMNDYMTFVSGYNSVIMLVLIPIFALFTRLAFWKWGHNYYEHVVMNSYILCFYTLCSIALVYPLFYFFSDPETFSTMTALSVLVVPFLLGWFFSQVYPDKPLKNVIGRVVLTLLYMMTGAIVLFILFFVGVVVYAMLNGPEFLQYMQPKAIS